jgi:hypothetical protein
VLLAVEFVEVLPGKFAENCTGTKAFLYESFILFYENKFHFSIETYVKSRGLVLASPPLYTCIVAKYKLLFVYHNQMN